jgi:1,4-alpha-glucan branching enzyme
MPSAGTFHPGSEPDEVVTGLAHHENAGRRMAKFANLRMFYAWMYGHPGKLLFMGGEFGQVRVESRQALDWG